VNDQDPAALARTIIDASSYLVLGTADESGRPRVSPVWFAHEQYREFFWVSYPDARHSQNLPAWPEVSIAIFDSHQPPGTSEGVYVSATAEEVADADVDHGMSVFSRKAVAQGMKEWTRSDVRAPAGLRLYRATGHEHFVLGERDRRIPVVPLG
jgi:Pyridoxamine 5'-phosphate oxidase